MEWARCTRQGVVSCIDVAALHHAFMVDRCLLWNAAYIHNELHISGFTLKCWRWVAMLDESARGAFWYSVLSVVKKRPGNDCRYIPYSLISTRAFLFAAFTSASRRQVRPTVKQTCLSWVERCTDLVIQHIQDIVRIPLPSGEVLDLCPNGTVRNFASFSRLLNRRMLQDVQSYIEFR